MSATAEAEAGTENGRSIEDAANDPNSPGLPQQEPLPGTGKQLTLIAGGEEPSSSEVKFRGGAVPLEGQYDKGDIVEVVLKIRIGEVAFADTHDKYGNVTSTVRRHTGVMIGATRK